MPFLPKRKTSRYRAEPSRRSFSNEHRTGTRDPFIILLQRFLELTFRHLYSMGANEHDIMDTLELANDYANMEWDEFEAKYKDKLNDGLFDYLSEN